MKNIFVNFGIDTILEINNPSISQEIAFSTAEILLIGESLERFKVKSRSYDTQRDNYMIIVTK